jgi:glucan 1,3-beta-glucosidase
MIFARTAIVSAFALGATCAHFEIPQVERIVSNILQEYENIVHYSGNQTNDTHISKRATTPYWYETIAHQGISAFGPGGYQVYRNVRDYGAKGIFLGMRNPALC